MHEPVSVREAHGFSGTLHDLHEPHRHAQAGALVGLDQVAESAAADLGHGIEGTAVGEDAGLMHRNQAGVVETGENLGFMKEAAARGRVAAQFIAQLLDRHGPVQVGIVRLEDDGHAALAEGGAKPVAVARDVRGLGGIRLGRAARTQNREFVAAERW